MGAARDATYQVYKADNNLALGPTMFNKMRADNVDVVSDSWGLCEVLVPPKLTLTENTSLELLAAGGSSLYVASGDNGSADCKSASARAQVPGDRRPVGPAVRDGRGRHEPQTRPGPTDDRGRLEGLRRRGLVQLAAAWHISGP